VTTFFFRAVAPDGKLRTGSLAGESDKLVARELQRQGLTPVYVGVEAQGGRKFKLPGFGGQRRRDVLFFTQELSTLLTSGIPVDRALSIAGELSERPHFRGVILEMLRVLKTGRSLADSLAAHPEYFSELYLNMVRAGEASGSLAAVFERLADFERSRDDLRSYIITSMIYPALLLLVGLGSILVLLTFVVPRFATVFQESRIKIPTPTLLMLETSKIIQNWWWLALLIVVGAVTGWRAYIATAEGKQWWHRAQLKLPLIGDVLRKADAARFARAMATLVANSVPLVQSIGISAAILSNSGIAAGLRQVAQGVKRGEGIAGPLRKVAVFPPLAAHLLTVGEETGRLDHMFNRMADIYENDTRAAVKRFTSLFEPLIILVMGVLVGALILSMLLAITSINDVAV
jgi:general secretion pathway protein F